jgi:hypothetical protein
MTSICHLKKMIAGLLVDNLWTTRRKHARLIHIIDTYLTVGLRSTRTQRAPKAGSSRVRLVLLASLLFNAVGVTPSHSVTESKEDKYKLYAHSRIENWTQFVCFHSLIEKENSTWSPTARNGSHYGIGQMRNTKYKLLDGYSQIDWTLRYITNRYQTPCKAWAFFKKNGYH